jgi:hypothetical protein
VDWPRIQNLYLITFNLAVCTRDIVSTMYCKKKKFNARKGVLITVTLSCYDDETHEAALL